MSIQSVNPVYLTSAQTNFGSNLKNAEAKTSAANDVDIFEKKELSKGKKIAIGVGVASAVLGGAYLVKSGKLKSAIDNIKKLYKSKYPKIEDLHFKNGKAITCKGENFTGTVNHVTKSGKPVKITYENGLLKESVINNGEIVKKYDIGNNLSFVDTVDKTKNTITRLGLEIPHKDGMCVTSDIRAEVYKYGYDPSKMSAEEAFEKLKEHDLQEFKSLGSSIAHNNAGTVTYRDFGQNEWKKVRAKVPKMK